MDTRHETRHLKNSRLIVCAPNVLLLFVVMIGLNWQQMVKGQEVASGECMCKVRFVGEYCGSALNEQEPSNNCTTDMFFCGKSNLNRKAVVLKPCLQKGFECNKKLNGG